MPVNPIYVLDLAAQHARWASVRQAVITGNIANANTHGYNAQDIEPFSAVLDNTTSVAMAETAPGHVNVSGSPTDSDARIWESRETGRPVSLDQQLMQADQANRAFALDTSIVRAFHRMLMASVRSG